MKKKSLFSNKGNVTLILCYALVAIIIFNLGWIQLVNGDKYSAIAENQLLGDRVVNAKRGTIYDATMNVLAKSADVWCIFLDPSAIYDIKEKNQAEARAIIENELSVILDVEAETISKYLDRTTSAYERVKGQVEKAERDEVQQLIDKYANRKENSIDLSGVIRIDPDVKRYYPHSTLASTVIGWTGDGGAGRAGLENYYDDVLTGVAGRTLTALKGNGAVMPNQYETVYDAEEGASLVLTLDIQVQYILEDVLSQALEETKAQGVYGIVMDVDTGAILAMASLPDYDLNSPKTLANESLISQFQEALSAPEDASEYTSEMRNLKYYQNKQWINHNVISTYEPGSVFKVITAAAAVEEGVADLNTTHYCTGVINYATRNIHCWRRDGHGAETFVDLLKNSCNPFAVTLADSIGGSVFYDYFEAFGFTEKTGIDTAGDRKPSAGVLYMERENFTKSDLASYSFGQTFQVSPLQMITAISAIANGGKLMTPYLVSKQLDSEGNTIKETTPVMKRQVVSERTAGIIADCMEQVVSTGTGKNAYVAGYHVAGKTGTSEKLNQNNINNTEEYIASFCGFAPANDPEISVIIIVDNPKGEHGGGAVAAPLAGDVFEQVLEYLGVERSYTEAERQKLVKYTPDLVGKTAAEAKSMLKSSELEAEIIGDGDTVVFQYPEAGRALPSGGMVVLYTTEDYEAETVIVPDFTGLTVSEANRLALNSGLNIRISGSSLNSGSVFAYKQNRNAGESVNKGEIINVSFKTTVGVSD